MIPRPETLKALLDKRIKKIEPPKEKVYTFFEYFEDSNKRSREGTRMNLKTKTAVVLGTNKGFVNLYNHLKKFQAVYKRKIDFATIDLEFYNDYVKYLTQTMKLGNNTSGDHIKRIKTTLNEATDKGINTNLAFRSRYFAKLSENSDSIYLNEAELREVEELDLSANSKLDRVRDLFLVCCYTGLRFGDASRLRPEQIKNGFIEITQSKTGNPVAIPVHDTLEKIMQKYNGTLPRSLSNQKTNDYLKDIGKKISCLQETVSKTYTKAGIKLIKNFTKWELLSTHTARRSFATNEYLAGTPTLTIMRITGHKSEAAFLKYVKLTPMEHAQILKRLWDQRSKQKKAELRAV
jgi:integrase